MSNQTEIEWLPEAIMDLYRLREFIAEHNPVAAQKASERILGANTLLASNPLAGKPSKRTENFRDLVIPFGSGSYTLRYRIDQKKLYVVRVWHDRESKPE